ncbi:hypothetical protein UFOVP1254_44 [uncultured Caudovirales phage]|uniref:Uncharacterized protein n=1 Tax=uncultured Caudovirales phage TaxID=2100421 RepID=A0A6J5RJB0_9CAUD|nr:hypothetical protein UFOVP1254_44 [uncultured Caudovirales phage]
MKKQLTFSAFRTANVTRCLKWHPQGIDSWSSADWFVAILGEFGELASLVKMWNRERDDLPGNKFAPTAELLGKEAADVVTYLDLFCASWEIPLCPTFESFGTMRDNNFDMFSRFNQQMFTEMDNSAFMVQLAQEIGKLSLSFRPLYSKRDIQSAVSNILQWLDIFCYRNGVNLQVAVVQKFNEISERVGFPDRICLFGEDTCSKCGAVGQYINTLLDDHHCEPRQV